MIKVNQVTSKTQSEKLLADIIGVVAGATVGTSNEAFMAELRSRTAAKISVTFEGLEASDRSTIASTLDAVKPDFYEFTPADPDKVEAHEADLDLLRTLPIPKIANGFFLMKDDLSLLEKPAYFERLMAAGVVLFQFEIGSLLDPDFTISRRDATRIDDFLAKVPGLICDQFDSLSDYPLTSAAGFYLNLERSGNSPASYDYSELEFPLSQVVRLTRGSRARS